MRKTPKITIALLTLAMAIPIFGFASEASAQSILRESRRDGKRVHKRAKTRHQGKVTRKKRKVRKKAKTTRTRTRTVHRDRYDRSHRHGHRTHHRRSVVHRRTHVSHGRRVHFRRHRTYRYVRPRFHWVYYDRRIHHNRPVYRYNDTQVVIVEVDNEPDLPELDCPIRTRMNQSANLTFCATPRGTKHGPYVRYYESGAVAAEGKYEYGTREGFWVEYHQNGELRLEGEYDDGERIGTWYRFNRDGEEVSVTTYE